MTQPGGVLRHPVGFGAPPPDFLATIADFVGRQWLFDRLRTWLAAPGDEPVFSIVGGPGMGKTALAAKLAELLSGTGDRVVYAHFCRVSSDRSLDGTEFVRDLASHLAGRSTAFRQAVLDDAQRGDVHLHGAVDLRGGSVERGGTAAGIIVRVDFGESARVAFQRLIRRPLEAARLGGLRDEIVILLDALDEAYSYSPREGVHALVPMLAGLPSVRVIVTTRPDPRVLRLLREPSIGLRQDVADEIGDVTAYLEARLAAVPQPSRRQWITRILDAGGANFLYARYTANGLLRSGAIDDADPARFPLAPDLASHYREFLERELRGRDDWWRERYRPVLGVLAVARGVGLTRAELAVVTGLEGPMLDDVLVACAQYLSGGYPDGPFTLYHHSFRDFLSEDQDFNVYPAHAASGIVESFIAPFAGRWSDAGGYALGELAGHVTTADQANRLLEDSSFLIHADWRAVAQLLPRAAGTRAVGRARVVRLCLDAMRTSRGAARASYLQLVAKQQGAHEFAGDLDDARHPKSWVARWANWRTVNPNEIVGRHTGARTIAMEHRDGTDVLHSATIASVRTWEVSTGRLLGEVVFDGYVGAARHGGVGLTELSGAVVAVGSDDTGEVVVRDPVTGAEVLRFRGLRQSGRLERRLEFYATSALQFDGRAVAVAVTSRGVHVWFAGSEAPALWVDSDALYGKPVACARFGPYLCVAVGDEVTYGRVDGTNPSRLRLPTRTTPPESLHLTDLGDRLIAAVGLRNGRVEAHVIERAAGAGLRVRSSAGWSVPGGENVTAVSVVPGDAEPVVVAGTGGTLGTLSRWGLDSGASLGTPLTGHDGEVSAVGGGRIGGRLSLVSAGANDWTLRVWDDAFAGLDHGSPRPAIADQGWLYAAAVASAEADGRPRHPANGAVLAGGYGNAVHRLSLAGGTPLGPPLNGHRAAIRALAFGTVGDQVVAASAANDGTVRLWDPVAGTPLAGPLRHAGGTAFSVDLVRAGAHSYAVSGGEDNTVRIWHLQAATTRPGRRSQIDVRAAGSYAVRGWAWCLAAGAIGDEAVVAAAGWDSTAVDCWRVAPQQRIGTYELSAHVPGPTSIGCLRFADWGGRTLLVAGAVNAVIIVDVLSGDLVRVLKPSEGTGIIDGLAIGTFGDRLVIAHGSVDGRLFVWTVDGTLHAVIRTGARIMDVASAGDCRMVTAHTLGLVAWDLSHVFG